LRVRRLRTRENAAPLRGSLGKRRLAADEPDLVET
jgi:hypothetical protein